MTGVGGDRGGGITISDGALVESTGSAAITLRGTAGPGSGAGVTIGDSGTGVSSVNGAIDITAGGAVSDVLISGAVSSGSGTINVTSGRAITEGVAGTFSTRGLLRTQSNAGQSLNSGNTVGSFNASNTGPGATGSITLNNTSAALTITGITNTADNGNITVTNAGAITSSGPITTPGNLNVSALAGPLTLAALNVGALNATSAGALVLGQGNVNGALIARSNGGAVSQSGALNVFGATTINAGDGAITLTAANDFAGVVNLTGSTIDIVDRNQLNVVVNATGATRVTGNLTYAGTSGDLTLNATPNPDGTLTFGDTLVRGNLVATAADSVTQLAGTALNVAGTTSIDASANGSSITLANAGNHFGTLATFKGGAINVADNAALNAVLSGTGLATLSAATAMTVSGAAAGFIGNAGTTMTVGTAGLNAGAGALRLVSPGDLTLNGAVSSAAAGDAVILASTAGNFVNNAGASAVGVAANGRFLVYSGSPLTDTSGGLSAPNIRFGTQLGDAITFSGSGFLYRTGLGTVNLLQPAQVALALNSNFVAQQVDHDLSGASSGLFVADRLRAGSAASDAKVADLCWTTADDQPCESDRRRARTARYKSALEVIRKAPTVADVPLCGPNAPDVCMPTKPGIVADAEQGAPDIAIPVADVRKKVAFLIGNNDYKSDIPRLETPIADVAAIGKVLSERLGYEVTVLNNATKAGMVQVLKALAESATQHESVLIFYAGHGYQMDDTKAGFWLPTDASASDPKTWLSNNDIQRFLNRIDAKQIMVVSDSCFSGTLTKEQTIDAPRTAPREQILSRRAVVTLSSGDEEPVTDEGLGGHSIFAYHFLNELQRIEKMSPISAAYERLRERVAKAYPQTPQLGGVRSAGHMTGANYLLEVK